MSEIRHNCDEHGNSAIDYGMVMGTYGPVSDYLPTLMTELSDLLSRLDPDPLRRGKQFECICQ
jgi:hypothetical protein